jgi:hypothetical protein
MLSADHKSVKFVTKDTDIERGKLKLRTPERWQSGRMRRFAKPLYGLTPVPRVRIPPSPPVLFVIWYLPPSDLFSAFGFENTVAKRLP